MRADRLIATLLVLQRKGRVTARQLADELEVSLATARRDLEASSTAGLPVYPQPGRHGGWSVLGGARTDLSGLSAHEVRALFRLAGPAAEASPEARAALRKLVRALPETFRTEAESTAAATLVDPERWGGRVRQRPALADRLEEAVVRRRRTRLVYTGGGGRRSDRLVEPWALVAKDDTWYLVTGTDQGRRVFRLDRIEEADVTEEAFERKDQRSVTEAWAEIVGAVEEKRSRTWATLLVDEQLVFVLREQFGRHCEVGAIAEDGRATVRVAAPTPLDIARHLAGWGAAVQVLGPAAVQQHLGRIGAELAARYPASA